MDIEIDIDNDSNFDDCNLSDVNYASSKAYKGVPDSNLHQGATNKNLKELETAEEEKKFEGRVRPKTAIENYKSGP